MCLSILLDAGAAQGGTSALRAAEVDSEPVTGSSTFSSQHGFVLLAVVCAVNAVAVVAILARLLRRGQQVRDDDVISVSSDQSQEPVGYES